MKIYARWGLAAFACFGLSAVSLAADVTNPVPGQPTYGGAQYYGPGYGPGYYGPMNNGCSCCGQAYGWPPPGSQPFQGYQGPVPDCGSGWAAGRSRWRRKFCSRGQGGNNGGNGGNGDNGDNGPVPTMAAFPSHPFARSPRDYFMLDQPCGGERPCP
jgi:hypothetical protein